MNKILNRACRLEIIVSKLGCPSPQKAKEKEVVVGRVITNIVVSDKTVFLISIYDKSEKENLTDGELKDLLSKIAN